MDVRSGFGSSLLKLGYLKAFMDGTLGSETARLLDGSGVQSLSDACHCLLERPRSLQPHLALRQRPRREVNV